ncbi:4'-phosphopantetheinyl transferase family protein [Bacillus gaemokensis]|uniref:4'-phosphopantetheinyl transferase family protein n=1 Tax=Bacillus gaemokensis TaxID=574375 RepID=UPI00068FF957|nr:4'-phosphopantetheinyl transferase superfamily protein [Bacillus gaemokensis]KYG37666.1 hypothetical protein AZF08_23080 [Bacillus gaemokensis]
MIGISDCEIGVDIEKLETLDFINLSTFFSEPEQAYLKNLDHTCLKDEFYRIWTANESYVKFLGKGLSVPLNSFVVPLKKNDNLVLNSSRDSRKNPEIQLFFLEDYSMSICSQKFDNLSFNYYNAAGEIVTLNENRNGMFPKIESWK